VAGEPVAVSETDGLDEGFGVPVGFGRGDEVTVPVAVAVGRAVGLGVGVGVGVDVAVGVLVVPDDGAARPVGSPPPAARAWSAATWRSLDCSVAGGAVLCVADGAVDEGAGTPAEAPGARAATTPTVTPTTAAATSTSMTAIGRISGRRIHPGLPRRAPGQPHGLPYSMITEICPGPSTGTSS
jgi:hypothetical protein